MIREETQEAHGSGVRGGGRFNQGCIAASCGGVDELAYLPLPLIIIVLGGETFLVKHLDVSTDEDIYRHTVPGSGCEVEGFLIKAVVGHEVLGLPVFDLAAADERVKQLAILDALVAGWNHAGNIVAQPLAWPHEFDFFSDGDTKAGEVTRMQLSHEVDAYVIVIYWKRPFWRRACEAARNTEAGVGLGVVGGGLSGDLLGIG